MANLTSLMTGGWELDNDLGASTNAELKQEEFEKVMETLRFYLFSGDWETHISGLDDVQKHNAYFDVKEAWEYVLRHNITLDEIKEYSYEKNEQECLLNAVDPCWDAVEWEDKDEDDLLPF